MVRRGAINTPEIAKMVQRSRASDQPSARDLTVRRPGRRQAGVRLRVRVAPMADGSALVLVDDITEAERLDHARRDFVANVSHELKTPIGALALLAEAVHEAQDDPDAVERFTTRMLGETRRLTTLLNDLMDLSRLEGVEPLQPMEPVEVDEVVAQACDDARSLAQDKDITFLRGGVAGLRVEGVPVQLATAVRNLIVNAVNYSPPATKVAVTTGISDGIGHDRGHRPGHRHPAGGAGPDLRALLPGGPRAVARHRRDGPGPVHRQARVRQPRRRLRRVVEGRGGLHLHDPIAGPVGEGRQEGVRPHQPAPSEHHPKEDQ